MAALISATLVCLAWCYLALWIGPRLGYVDEPGDSSLKVHSTAAVPLGGVGVYLGFHVASLLEGDVDWALLVATSIVLVLGLVDDRRGLPPLPRLLVEVVAAVVLVASIHDPTTQPAHFVLGVLLVVFAINAVNLFDGLDGLAGSVGLVTALGIGFLALERGLPAGASWRLAAALLGFLVLAWHPAKVFLGDAGAYVLGVILAGTIIQASTDGIPELVIASALLGVFAVDLMVTMARRVRSGHPLFLGDRSHIYDQLRDRGMTVPSVVLVFALSQAVVVLLVLGVDRWWPSLVGVLILGLVGAAGVGALAGRGYLGSRQP